MTEVRARVLKRASSETMVPPWVKLAWLLLAAGASCSGDGVGAILRPPPTTWGQTPIFCTLRPLCVKLWGPTVCRTPNCRVLPALAWRVCSGHSSNTSGPLSAEAILFIKRHNFSLIALEKNTMINLPPVADDAEKKIVQQARCTCRPALGSSIHILYPMPRHAVLGLDGSD